VVGIPALIIYNYFINRERGFIFQMETAAEEVMDMLSKTSEAIRKQPQKEPPAEPPKDPMETGERTRLAGETGGRKPDGGGMDYSDDFNPAQV
jgi:hypothetical protein